MKRASIQIAALALLAAAAPVAWADADIIAALFQPPASVNAGVDNNIALNYTFSGIDEGNCSGVTLEIRINGAVVHSGPAIHLNGTWPMVVNLSAAELSFPAIRSTGTTSVAVEAFFGGGCDDTAGADIVNTALNIIPQTPTISSLGITTIPAGNGDRTVTVTGNFLYDDTQLEVQTPAGTQTLSRTDTTTITGNVTSASYTIPAARLLTAGTTSVRAVSDPSVFSSAFTGVTIVAPAITSFSPNPIPAGSGATVTINGSNFVSGASVLYTPPGGAQTTLASTFSSANQISFTLTAGQATPAGQASVIVRNAAGASVSNTSTLNIAPVISDISPTTAPAGSTIPLTVNGSQFLNGAVIVWTPPGGAAADLATTFVNGGQLTATIPIPTATGAGSVVVRNPSSISSVAATLTITGPTISLVNPNTAFAAAADTAITVTGTNYINGATVVFTPSGGSATDLATVFVNSTQLTATIPTGLLNSAGAGSITVRNTGSVVSTGSAFTVNAPTLTSVTPANGPSGGAQFVMTLAGTNFVSTSVARYLAPGSGSPTDLVTTFVNSNQLTAVVPAALQTGSGTAVVTVKSGNAISGTQDYTVAGPTLTNVSPNNVLAGAADFTLVATGTNFGPSAKVQWTPTSGGGTTELTTTVVNTTRVEAAVPAALLLSSGTVNVTVANNVSSVTASQPLVIGTFTLTSISPSAAIPGGPTFSMTLSGINIPNTAVVTWDDGTTEVDLSTSFVNSTQLVALVPAAQTAAAGTALVRIRNGAVKTAAQTFIVSPAPVIDSLAPSIVPPGSPSFTMIVTGSGFQNASTVTWTAGGAPQTLTSSFISAAQLSVTVPATLVTAAGTAVVEVTNPGPFQSNPRTFTVGTQAAVVTGLSPQSATAGGATFILTVSGQNFVSGAQVQWSSGGTITPLTTTFIGSTQLTAVVPDTLISGAGTVQVSVAQGGTTSNAQSYTIVGAAPSVTSITPDRVTPGSAAFQLTVNGSGFLNGATVYWNAGSAPIPLATGFISSTQLAAIVPATLISTAGAVLVTVSNPGSAQSTPLPLTVGTLTQPAITTLNPNSTTAGGPGFTLAINGSNFAAGATVQWSIGGTTTPLTTNFISSTQLTAAVASAQIATAGVASISVSQAGGTSNTVTMNVTGTAPLITSVTPDRIAPGSADFQLTINGTGFLSGLQVNWNVAGVQTQLSPTFVSPTQIISLVPANLITVARSVLISVTNPGGAVSNGFTFQVSATTANPPTLISINPNVKDAGSGSFPLIANGTNFDAGTQIRWTTQAGTQILTTGFISTGQIQALVPASLSVTPGTVLVSVVNQDGVASASLPLSIVSGTAPTLTTLSPDRVTVGSAAFQLRANGTNFVSGSTIQWNNGATTQPLSTSFTSSTEVTAVVPANLIATQGVALISVVSPGGLVSNALSMPIAGVSGVTPVINPAGLSPDNVTAGSATFQLSLTGTSFSPGAQVQWTTQAGRVSLTTGFGSSTALTALVPAELVRNQGIALISVLNVDGATSNSVTFSIPAGTAPGITSVTPTSLTVGAAGQLTVQGTGFSQNSIVQWNTGTTTVPLSTGFVSATQLSVVVPATLTVAPAVALITVENPGGVISNAVTVAISPATGLTPAVNTSGGLAPSSTTAGSSSFQLTVSGTNFVSGSQVQWTTQTGTTALTTGFVSGTQLTALVPSSFITSPGNVLISVLNPGGAVSNSVSMEITSGQAPTVNTTGGLSPDKATVGGPSFQLTVSGTNFIAGSQVQWSGTGGSLTLTTGFVNGTTLTAVVPSNLIAAVGSAIVTVVNPGGAQSNAVSFTVANVTGESPRVDTVNPNRRPAGSGQFELAITGANFVNGSVVNWNPGNGAQQLATGFVSAQQLTALVPANLTANAGVALITVVNPGNASSNSITFEIENSAGASPPTVSANNGLQPQETTAGSAAFTMAVNGTSFANGSIVQWNAGTGPQNLVTGFVSATQLTALVPTNLITTPGAVFVTVLNPGGLSSNAATFTVKPPAGNIPVINESGGLNPASAPATSASFQLTLTGSSFVNGAVVQWTSGGGVTPLATGFISATQLTAIVPANLITTQGVAFVRVVNPGGASSNAATFTIQAASGNVPTINSSGGLNPAASSVGSSGFQLTITGSNFINGSVVQWNPGSGPQALTTGFVTTSTLTALVPSSFLTAPGTVFITVLNPGGASSNSVSFAIGGASPIITGLGQTTIPAGFGPLTLAVNGQNFGSGATVRWATQNLPTTSNGPTQLIASVPGNLTNGVGTFDITVTGAAGTSNAVQISVSPAQVTLLSPRTAPAGSPPFSLSVGGSNFVSGSQVLFGTTPLTTAYVSPTELTAQVTAILLASAGNINVLVQNPGGSQSNATAFAIGASPNIASIAPASASAGSQAITITVTGTNFANGDVVHWNGSPLSTTFASNTQLTARVGAELLAQAGAVNVSVIGRSSSNVVPFSIGGPTVTTLLPAAAAAGATTLQLKVTGTGFVTGTAVLWNNTLLPTSLNSATELTAVVESSLLANPGIAFVGVSSPGGARSERMSFTIEGPTLAQVSPTSITAGGPTFSITVTGTNFVNGATVMWDANSLPTTFGSATQLTAQVAANLIQSAATVTVLVRNPGGAQTSSRPFTISAPPAATVTGLNPPNAVAGSAAFQLTIVGTNFMQGAVVQWNGQPLPTSFTNATQLSALVDTPLIASAGTANVSVLNPGSPVSESTRFTINGPSITTLSPNNVAAASLPFEMTITGLNFLPGSVIEWNGLAQPTAFTSATQLRATIPTDLIRTAASVSVTVRNPGGAVSPAASFNVGPFTLAIDTTSLRDAIVGRSYSETIVARGGTPPYTYSLAGALPDGMTLEPATGSISGTPLAPGTVNFTITVTDGERRTVTRPFTLRTAPALTITTAAALPNVLVGGNFSATMTAAGGTAPYIWSAPNQLPPGLSLNGTTGELAGTPTTAGTYRFQIRCRDSRQQDEPRDFVVIVLPGVPGFTIGGVSESMQPALQPRIEISIAQPYPVELQGVLNMTYSSDVGGDDSSVQFSTGGRRVTFTIPPGSTTAMYGEIEELSMGTGTLASTITLRSTLTAGTLIVTPVPVPVRTIRIARAVPVLTSVTFTRGDTGVIVTMTGFSTTREIQRGTFRFNPRAGSNITSSEVTSQLANLFQQWYQGQGTSAVGSQFRLSMPFNVSGRVDAIESVTVTLTNNQGASQAVTADLQ